MLFFKIETNLVKMVETCVPEGGGGALHFHKTGKQNGFIVFFLYSYQ